MTAGSANISQAQFPAAFLQALGFPTSQPYVDVISAWTRMEGPTGGWAWQNNNPLNAKCGWAGQTGCATGTNAAGQKVQIGVYPDLQAAIDSYVGTIKTGAHGYSGINPSNASTPLALANAISQSDWAGSSHYSSYKASVVPQGSHTTVTLSGVAAYLYNQKAGSTPQSIASFFSTYNSPMAITSNVVAPPGSPVANASNAAQGAVAAAQNTANAVGNLASIIGDWISKPDFPINAIVLLTGLIMLVLGLKSLVGSQAGQAINIIGGTTNDVRNSRVAGSIREGINVAGQPAEAVPADFKPEPASETFTLPEFLKQVSTSESHSYSPETPRAASPSKSALRHRATRAQDRAAIAAFNAAPAEALV